MTSVLGDRGPEADGRAYLGSLERSRQSRTRPDRPRVFSLGGRDWDLFDDVFAPPHSPSTEIVLAMLGLTGDPAGRPATGSLLEIGCGTGVVAVTGALLGCERVVATDISPQAVTNAARNAERHGVADRVRTVCSDLFDQLAPERFDTIIWSSNYVLAPADFEYSSIHERAYVDPGYAAHRRYLAEAPGWTTEGGRALLHFSSRGDGTTLHRIAADLGRELRVLDTASRSEGPDLIHHYLLQVVAG
jgi:release factor glutamine methyltransferase